MSKNEKHMVLVISYCRSAVTVIYIYIYTIHISYIERNLTNHTKSTRYSLKDIPAVLLNGCDVWGFFSLVDCFICTLWGLNTVTSERAGIPAVFNPFCAHLEQVCLPACLDHLIHWKGRKNRSSAVQIWQFVLVSGFLVFLVVVLYWMN